MKLRHTTSTAAPLGSSRKRWGPVLPRNAKPGARCSWVVPNCKTSKYRSRSFEDCSGLQTTGDLLPSWISKPVCIGRRSVAVGLRWWICAGYLTGLHCAHGAQRWLFAQCQVCPGRELYVALVFHKCFLCWPVPLHLCPSLGNIITSQLCHRGKNTEYLQSASNTE